MKPNNYLVGRMAMRGSINWEMEIACFLLLLLIPAAGIYAFSYFARKVSSYSPLSQVECDFKSFESALAMYKLNGRSFPSTAQGLKALVEKPTDDPVPIRWVQIMPKIPLDPWGKPYIYQFPGSKHPETFEIISSGPDGMNGTRDDLSSQDE